MDLAILVLLAEAFCVKVTSFITYVSVKEWPSVVKQLVAWLGGTGFIALAKIAGFGSGVGVWGQTLDAMNVAAIVLLGLSFGSLGSQVVDVLKAIKGGRIEPKMAVPGSGPAA